MNGPKEFADAIAALITSDATFVAALTALLGVAVSTVFRANQPIAAMPANALPCFVIEQGDGKTAPTTNSQDFQTIGLAMTSYASDLFVTLLWSDQDRDNAANARTQLPVLFAQLLMRNPQPGGIDGAVLAEWMPDRGINHPTQIWRAVIAGNYTITKT
jgi:hypothetical protein